VHLQILWPGGVLIDEPTKVMGSRRWMGRRAETELSIMSDSESGNQVVSYAFMGDPFSGEMHACYGGDGGDGGDVSIPYTLLSILLTTYSRSYGIFWLTRGV
jgi:hypothetical protein